MKNNLTIFFLLVCIICNAQNLVPNGGFEQYSTLPTGPAQCANSIGWTNCNGTGTPDYFHLNGTGYGQLPITYFATVYPHSGNAIMGLIIWHSNSKDFREYVSHALSEALTIGQSYKVSFYITNGVSNSAYGGCGVDQMSVALSTTPLTQNAADVISSVIPKYVSRTVLYDTVWQQITFTFIADLAYTHITLGSFANDASTAQQQFDAAGIGAAYYFIDDVSVSATTTGINNSMEKAEENAYPNPFSNQLTFSSSGNVPIIISLYNFLGQQVLQRPFTNSTTINTEQFADGIYFYELRNIKGTLKTGKLFKQ